MKLQVTCSMCGIPTSRDKGSQKIDIERIQDIELEALVRKIRREGWIVQVNGDNIDTYCCKACAK